MKSDQLSQTAAFVAIKFYGLTRMDQYRSLFDDSVVAFYEQLIQSLPIPLRYYHYWLQQKWVRRLYIWSEELLLPGDLLHIIARKWYIQRMAERLLDEGYEQLVVLGAGFDHLAFDFAQRGIDSFEFDAPHMAALKRHFLSSCYPGRRHPNIIISHLPNDELGHEFSRHPQIDSNKKTIVVAEGFFDYLPPHLVASSLGQIQQYFSHKPALISTHFALDELSSFHRWVFKTSVNLVSERLQFNASMEAFRDILTNQQFELTQLHDAHEINTTIKNLVKTTLPVLKGFYVLLAQ